MTAASAAAAHDAAQTIEAVGAHLRDQVDLDTLSAELLAVVNQTMEPTKASLWLRPSDKGALKVSIARPTTQQQAGGVTVRRCCCRCCCRP